MKIYGTLTQKEKNIMSSPLALEKYKNFVLADDSKGINNMMIFDVVYIPVIKTIVDEYPAYCLSIDWNFSLGNSDRYDIYDMSKFTMDFFKWHKEIFDDTFVNIDEFIIKHKLQEKVGWNE